MSVLLVLFLVLPALWSADMTIFASRQTFLRYHVKHSNGYSYQPKGTSIQVLVNETEQEVTSVSAVGTWVPNVFFLSEDDKDTSVQIVSMEAQTPEIKSGTVGSIVYRSHLGCMLDTPDAVAQVNYDLQVQLGECYYDTTFGMYMMCTCQGNTLSCHGSVDSACVGQSIDTPYLNNCHDADVRYFCGPYTPNANSGVTLTRGFSYYVRDTKTKPRLTARERLSQEYLSGQHCVDSPLEEEKCFPSLPEMSVSSSSGRVRMRGSIRELSYLEYVGNSPVPLEAGDYGVLNSDGSIDYCFGCALFDECFERSIYRCEDNDLRIARYTDDACTYLQTTDIVEGGKCGPYRFDRMSTIYITVSVVGTVVFVCLCLVCCACCIFAIVQVCRRAQLRPLTRGERLVGGEIEDGEERHETWLSRVFGVFGRTQGMDAMMSGPSELDSEEEYEYEYEFEDDDES